MATAINRWEKKETAVWITSYIITASPIPTEKIPSIKSTNVHVLISPSETIEESNTKMRVGGRGGGGLWN